MPALVNQELQVVSKGLQAKIAQRIVLFVLTKEQAWLLPGKAVLP